MDEKHEILSIDAKISSLHCTHSFCIARRLHYTVGEGKLYLHLYLLGRSLEDT